MTLIDLLASLGCSPGWADPLTYAMEKWHIAQTAARREMFLAQVLHESVMLSHLQENLHYTSGARLLAVFPHHFTSEIDAQAVANAGPAAVGNRVYANRMGNGNETSGDGWNYRGRGLIQLTGRDNYAAAGGALALDLIGNPDLLLDPGHAADSAGWFWDSHGCNGAADLGDFVAVTKHINGGLLGLADRQTLLARVRSASPTL